MGGVKVDDAASRLKQAIHDLSMALALIEAPEVRRAPKVLVGVKYDSFPEWWVRIDDTLVAWFPCSRHAVCYAEKLRSDPTLRAEALGQ